MRDDNYNTICAGASNNSEYSKTKDKSVLF